MRIGIHGVDDRQIAGPKARDQALDDAEFRAAFAAQWRRRVGEADRGVDDDQRRLRAQADGLVR
jgi:hypothetical protein